jgi:hypothetical protein
MFMDCLTPWFVGSCQADASGHPLRESPAENADAAAHTRFSCFPSNIEPVSIKNKLKRHFSPISPPIIRRFRLTFAFHAV